MGEKVEKVKTFILDEAQPSVNALFMFTSGHTVHHLARMIARETLLVVPLLFVHRESNLIPLS